MSMDFHTLLQDVASVATAGGVFLAARELYLAKDQAQSQFEDSLNAQYRDILKDVPLGALLGQRLADSELTTALPVLYRYFDLSNEEAFLQSQGRVRPETWANWVEGIEQNMARPAFQQAWESMLPHFDGSFDGLKAIEARRRRPLPNSGLKGAA